MLLLAAGAQSAHAHTQFQDAMWVQFEPTLVRVAVNASLREIAIAQGLNSLEQLPIDGRAYGQAATNNAAYILRHLKLSSSTNTFAGTLVAITPPPALGEPEQTFYQYELAYPYRGEAPREMGFSQDMLSGLSSAALAPWDVSYCVRSRSSDFNQAATWLLPSGVTVSVSTGLMGNNPAADRADSEGRKTFFSYLLHGTRHILAGYDHLLFVAALVLATVGLWDLFRVIAAFTLAHSLTLALSVFGIVHLPSSIVEPLIAVSIIAVALENVLWPGGTHSRFRLLAAFGFGLVHGLGFAGGLLAAMKGLPSIGIWIALAAFSLGMEAGNQILVLPQYGTLAWLRRSIPPRNYRLGIQVASVLIACFGCYFLFTALSQ